MNALPDRYASDDLVLGEPGDGRNLARRLSKRYAARITGAFVVPGREGRFAPLPDDLEKAGEIILGLIDELQAARRELEDASARCQPIEAAFEETGEAANRTFFALAREHPRGEASRIPEAWFERIKQALVDLNDAKVNDPVERMVRLAAEAKLAGVDESVVQRCAATAEAFAKDRAVGAEYTRLREAYQGASQKHAEAKFEFQRHLRELAHFVGRHHRQGGPGVVALFGVAKESQGA